MTAVLLGALRRWSARQAAGRQTSRPHADEQALQWPVSLLAGVPDDRWTGSRARARDLRHAHPEGVLQTEERAHKSPEVDDLVRGRSWRLVYFLESIQEH